MATQTQSQLLFSAIEGFNARLDKLTEVLESVTKKTVELDTWRTGQADSSRRFWDQTWPTQIKLVDGIEERVRMLERDRVTQERLREIEKSYSDGLSKLETSLTKQIDDVKKVLKEDDEAILGERDREREETKKLVQGLSEEVQALKDSDTKQRVYWSLIGCIIGAIVTGLGDYGVTFIAAHLH